MNPSEQENIFAETPVSKNAGDRAEQSLIDLDCVIGKLSVSPLPYEVTCLNADESSMGMATSDVSGADFLSAFDSISFDVHPELGDDVLKDIIGADSIYGVDPFGQTPDVGKDTNKFNLAVGISEAFSQRDGEAEVMGDEAQQSDHPLIVYTSSQRRSLRNNRSNQINNSRKTSEVCTKITENNSVVDLCSLQILRRRRSLSANSPRSYVWGSMVDNLPDFEEQSWPNPSLSEGKKPSRIKCVQKSRNSIRDQDDKKSLQKGCRPAGPLSFKIKLRNQSCAIGNVKERNTIHELVDSKENKVAEELPGDMVLPCERNLEKVISTDASYLSQHLDVTGIFEKPSFNNSSYHHHVSRQVVVNDLVASSENMCSDVGTSPDSEVINSLPDAPPFEKVPQNMQDTPIISHNVCASMGCVSSFSLPKIKSKNEKKKDKHYQLGSPSLERNLSGAEATVVVEAAAAELELIPCRSGKKFPKCSPAKRGGKNRSGNLDLPSKKENASKKKGNKDYIGDKHQMNRVVGGSGVFSRAENHLAAGHKTPSVLGESGALSKVLNGAMNNLQFISSGERNKIDQLRNAWVLCDNCQKWRRIPAVLADQIEETNRGWTCEDNMDTDFSDCSIPQEKSNSEINQELEISEEDAGDTLLMSDQHRFKVTKESSWSLIKSNLFLHRSRKKQTIDEVMVCHCKHPSDGRMGCRAKCLNRILNIECVKGTCPCGELCSNQQFQKRKYAKLERFKCGKKGYGLQALEAISEGQFLIEYVGEVLDLHAYEARQRQYALNGHRHFYFMTLNGSEVIDACAKGNLGRFINHSCDPNCRTEKWMVNGEVCVGLFAIRDIKKGEEVTFDYNYVRVFGAAAKKCVCGSHSCRGYIGGDPRNSEVIIQSDSDDEYPEPVMICEDDEMKSEVLNSFDNKEKESHRMKKPVSVVTHLESISGAQNWETSTQKVCVVSTSTIAKTSVAGKAVETVVGDKFEEDNFADRIYTAAVGELDINQVTGESLHGSASDAGIAEFEGLQSQTHPSSQLTDICLQSVGVLNKTISTDQHEFRIAQKMLTNPLSSAHGLEMTTAVSPNKSLSDTVECMTKLKCADVRGKDELAKSNSLAKTRHSSSIKKGKIKFSDLKEKGTPEVDQFRAPHKSKKQPQSLNSQFEAVEEKLNGLLEPEGGISKRKDASRGYLKLLFLTAASGNDAHGEAIQSNRDLSMILDALLKTKSRSVLVDIINKNGLQMLHNIMKRYRNIYNKTPILRKLLKVLEYLAIREILTLEHITGGPPRPGVESFKDSILTLTEHVNKQVHQIARNFRDRWIPRSLRKNISKGLDDGRIESHRSSVSQDHWSDLGGKPSEVAVSFEVQTTTASGTNQSSAMDQAASGSISNNSETVEKKPHKRKSRWDTPAEESPYSKLKINMESEIDDDKPPGFSSPCHNAVVPSDLSSTVIISNPERNGSTKLPFDIVLGNSQLRFVSRMPVSYGVPVSIVQQFGVESSTGWTVGPGVPFYPFPPLPPYEKGDRPIEPTEKVDFGSDVCTDHYAGKKHTRAWSEDLEENNVRSGGSHCLDRKYFRQQKLNHSKLAPPWVRMRNVWENNGNI